ncbi:MAG TPA: DUF2357 domain-containing protein, partial [Nitrospira sp.]|nr:DUF2357 domain-containing protein [Nitrospira sp.]
DQVRSIDAISQRWLARHPGAWYASRDEPRVASVSVGDSYVTPQQVLSARRIVTIDTPANRALKFVLSRLENRIRSVLRQIDDLPQKHFAGGEKGEYAAQLHQVLRDSQRYTVHGFLREVGAYPITPSAVHVVRADPRYRQAFRALSILNWGIFSRLEGPVAELALKDTWELYEYWVYLFVLDYFVSAGWECIAQGVISAAHPGSPIVIDLARGKDSESQFETVDPGVGTPKTATVAFHRVFPSRRQNTALGRGALTVERDVDILIEVESGGGLKRAVLDPKYRVEQDNGCLTCQVSAINDMHVYRDAVGRWEMAANGERYFVRTLDAAVAVFPSRDDECTATSLYTESLRDGIGALPLLPPDDEPPQLFYAFLEDLLS